MEIKVWTSDPSPSNGKPSKAPRFENSASSLSSGLARLEACRLQEGTMNPRGFRSPLVELLFA